MQYEVFPREGYPHIFIGFAQILRWPWR